MAIGIALAIQLVRKYGERGAVAAISRLVENKEHYYMVAATATVEEIKMLVEQGAIAP